MVTVNGEKVDAQGKTIAQFIKETGYNIDRVVVEVNLKIIDRKSFDSTILADGDSVEILNFVGGG